MRSFVQTGRQHVPLLRHAWELLTLRGAPCTTVSRHSVRFLTHNFIFLASFWKTTMNRASSVKPARHWLTIKCCIILKKGLHIQRALTVISQQDLMVSTTMKYTKFCRAIFISFRPVFISRANLFYMSLAHFTKPDMRHFGCTIVTTHGGFHPPFQFPSTHIFAGS